MRFIRSSYSTSDPNSPDVFGVIRSSSDKPGHSQRGSMRIDALISLNIAIV